MFPAATKAGGQCMAFPNVCKTPAPPAPPVPIPYPSIGMVNQASGTTKKVKVAGKPVVTKKSKMSRSMGDEAGVAGGVVSNVNMNQVTHKKGSSKVKFEGQPVEHLTAMTGHNGSNPNHPAGTHIVPGQTDLLIGI